MTDQPDYIPAFPRTAADPRGVSHNGMSLRDWFAGQALAGFIEKGNLEASNIQVDWQLAEVASSAYAIANAMLAEREKDKPDA